MSASPPDPNGCHDCGRLSCHIGPIYAARDAAWGAFDAAKIPGIPFSTEAARLRDVALRSSKIVTDAEDNCRKHRVDWRSLYFAALDTARDDGQGGT